MELPSLTNHICITCHQKKDNIPRGYWQCHDCIHQLTNKIIDKYLLDLESNSKFK